MDGKPFKSVENPGFLKLMYDLDPKFKVPTRKHLSKVLLPKLYKETKIETKRITKKNNNTYHLLPTFGQVLLR